MWDTSDVWGPPLGTSHNGVVRELRARGLQHPVPHVEYVPPEVQFRRLLQEPQVGHVQLPLRAIRAGEAAARSPLHDRRDTVTPLPVRSPRKDWEGAVVRREYGRSLRGYTDKFQTLAEAPISYLSTKVVLGKRV